MTEQFEKFYEWIRRYDSQLLVSNIEKDVEDKFVIPLFQHLCYPDTNRRPEFSIGPIGSSHKNSGRVDFAYFTEAEQSFQNGNTSLVLVEVKKVQEKDLTKFFQQIRSYCEHLKTPLGVITNGYSLVLFQQRRFNDLEQVFESNILDLRDRARAKFLYDLLNFEQVRRIKEALTDPLTYEKHVLLATALEKHPTILQNLQRGDFKPFVQQENNLFTVGKSTVIISCKLPHAFDEGSCEIRFSRALLPDLSLKLEHQEIINSFLLNLNTNWRLNLRRFLDVNTGNAITVRLGSASFTISEAEANDLCSCVDEIFAEYKQRIESSEDLLQSWFYPKIEIRSEGLSGFHLLTVPKSLWELMQGFANKFDYAEGNTKWHIFQKQSFGICIYPRWELHAMLYPYPEVFDLIDSGFIKVIYMPKARDENWHTKVGPQGIWSAYYTSQWLINEFIPAVIGYYESRIEPMFMDQSFISWLTRLVRPISDNQQQIQAMKLLANSVRHEIDGQYLSFDSITKPHHLRSYLNDIIKFRGVEWMDAMERIGAESVVPYYLSVLNLVKHARLSPENFHYIEEKLSVCRCFSGKKSKAPFEYQIGVFKDVLEKLHLQVKVVRKSGYESLRELDMVSRVFYAILRDEDFTFDQGDLNETVRTVESLWKQARFAERYVQYYH